MTKIQKIKKFVNDNADTIVAGTILTTMTALTVVVTMKAIKEQKMLDEWIQQKWSEGKVVHQLIDGSYIAVKHTQD